MMGWGFGMGLGGWLMMGGLWLTVVVAAVVAVMWIFPRDARGVTQPALRGSTTPAAVDPLGVLADRLACGEIDVATYRALRAELTGTDRAAR